MIEVLGLVFIGFVLGVVAGYLIFAEDNPYDLH